MYQLNKKAGLALMSLLWLAMGTAQAAHFSGCSVEEVVVVGDKNAHVQIGCLIGPRPSCATVGNFFGFDKSTPAGQDFLKTVLTAFSTNMKLTGYVHQGSCAIHQGNVADVYHLRLHR